MEKVIKVVELESGQTLKVMHIEAGFEIQIKNDDELEFFSVWSGSSIKKAVVVMNWWIAGCPA